MAEEEEEEFDEEYYLQQAIKLSMLEGAEAEKAEEPKAQEEPAQNLKDIVTTDFMKGIIDEMKLDIDESAMDDIMGQLDNNKKPD